jgi:hypothetical protein
MGFWPQFSKFFVHELRHDAQVLDKFDVVFLASLFTYIFIDRSSRNL